VPTVHNADDTARLRAAYLALSDALDAAEKLAHAMWRDGYLAALADLADLIGGRVFPPSPSPLEEARWGEGGREHFGDPRPGDFPGRGEAA
jgi:hypothetical protein